MEKYEKYKMWNQTWPEIKENLKANDIALISVSSTEQHGRHLPICTDAAIGSEACLRTLKKFHEATGQHALLAAEINIGMSKHHMSFPGTLSLEPETLMNVLSEVALGLVHHGYRKILIVNSHGGNTTVINAALRKVKDSIGDKKIFLGSVMQYSFETKIWNNEISDKGPTGSSHAGERETSCMMALGYEIRKNELPEKAILPTYVLPDFTNYKTTLYPGSVNWTWNMPEISKDGYMGDPTTANADKGERTLEVRSEIFAKFLKQLSELDL